MEVSRTLSGKGIQMSDNVLTALISASGMALTAITALILNYRGFQSIERRLELVEAKLNTIESVLRDFGQRIARLEERSAGSQLVMK